MEAFKLPLPAVWIEPLWLVVQILLIDIVFSLDSVITAVGMVNEVAIMITAVVVSIGIMMAFAGSIGAFVERHPTIKMLALSFLILIGVMLIAQGFDQKINKGYIYFAMAFSLFVELLNLRFRRKSAAGLLEATTDERRRDRIRRRG